MAVLIPIALLAYVVTPVTLIIGWVKWLRAPADRGLAPRTSFAAFVMGTLSALLAFFSILYSSLIGGFRYYDPKLLLIYRIGILLSFASLATALVGIRKRSAVRWLAPILSLGMLILWFTWAVGE